MAFDGSRSAALKGLFCFTEKRHLRLKQSSWSKMRTYKNFLQSLSHRLALH